MSLVAIHRFNLNYHIGATNPIDITASITHSPYGADQSTEAALKGFKYGKVDPSYTRGTFPKVTYSVTPHEGVDPATFAIELYAQLSQKAAFFFDATFVTNCGEDTMMIAAATTALLEQGKISVDNVRALVDLATLKEGAEHLGEACVERLARAGIVFTQAELISRP